MKKSLDIPVPWVNHEPMTSDTKDLNQAAQTAGDAPEPSAEPSDAQLGHRELLLGGLERIVFEVANAALERGVSSQELAALLRQSILKAASAKLTAANKKITASALHAATGIHRKEITNWLAAQSQHPTDAEAEQASTPKPQDHSAASRVIARWISDPDFLDEDEQPRPILIKSQDDAELNFYQLVGRVGPEVNPLGVLSGMEASGLVSKNGQIVSLRAQTYLPAGSSKDAYQFLSDNVGDHLAAALENTAETNQDPQNEETPKHFERAVFHTRLSEAEVLKLQKTIQTTSMTLLRRMIERLNAAEERDKKRGSVLRARRFRLGVYSYFAPSTDESSEGSDA